MKFLDNSALIKLRVVAIRLTLSTLWFLAASHGALAADIVYLGRPAAPSSALKQLTTSSKFYGLEIEAVPLMGSNDNAVLDRIRSPEIVAVVVDADVLHYLSREEVLKSLRRRNRSVPLLITDISERTDPVLLRHWSLGGISFCKTVSVHRTDNWYTVAKAEKITRQLGGSNLPMALRKINYLGVSNGLGARWLMEANVGNVEFPTFVYITDTHQDIFFSTEIQEADIPVTPDPYRQQSVFTNLASSMIFLRTAAGERAWHSPGDYANLTIDDLWLREPYGHVQYEKLVKESQDHNFHTTVAFIPWNFDRSEPKVVSLFLSHPDRLSIAIHGNNHIHQEFGPLDAHPLRRQTEDIEQGLARMERFTQLTDLPVDAVMVFPHSISPAATLGELKRYNFLATANSLNVPSDKAAPSDAEFVLRTGSLDFANFPSLRRYSVETTIPEAQLAIDAFLGNPMLFYAHESFFAHGINAFNETADKINALQPDTQWRGLGYIAKHLYLEKARVDGTFDIRAYSRAIDILNEHSNSALYQVEKEEDFSLPLTVFVDDHTYPYQRIGTRLILQISIASGKSRQISIVYANDLHAGEVNITKSSARINAVRLLSDFRDNVVSNSSLGRRFIRSYVDNGRNWNLAMETLGALLIVTIALSWMRRKRRPASLQLR